MNDLPARPPTFLDGMAAVFGAFRFLWREPSSWPLALVPALLFAIIATLALAAGASWITPHALELLGLHDPASWYSSIGQWLVKLLSTLLSGVVAYFVAFTLTPPLSAPALERLVGIQEAALGVAPRAEMSFVQEVWCGLKAQALALSVATPILAALWILDLLIPPAIVITTPLSIFVVSVAMAWNLFDYPLTLRGVDASDRIGFILAHSRSVLGFGLAFAALFWVPCFGILMLPVGAIAATRLVFRMLESAPEQLPALPRPNPAQLDFVGAGGAEARAVQRTAAAPREER